MVPLPALLLFCVRAQNMIFDKTGGEDMEQKKWQHLFVSPSYGRHPVLDSIYDGHGNLKTGRTLGQTYVNDELFPNGNVNFSLSWFYEIPKINPIVGEHVHDADELIFYMPSFNSKDDDVNATWGEATIYLEGEPYKVTDNCCIYIPGGLPHGPFEWNRVDRPHLFLTVMMSADYTRVENGKKWKHVNGAHVLISDQSNGKE